MVAKWTYIKHYIKEDNLISVSNSLAEAGWELVGFSKAQDCLPDVLFCIFKKMVERPKKGYR